MGWPHRDAARVVRWDGVEVEYHGKTSFIIYDSVLDALEAIGDKAKAFDAILAMRAYNAALSERASFDEAKYLADPLIRMVFTMQAPSIRANFSKWIESCLRNKRNRISSELKKQGKEASEENIRTRLMLRGELEDYLETERYAHDLKRLPNGRLTPDPPPVATSCHHLSPIVTDKDKETETDKETESETDTDMGTEADSVSDSVYEKGKGFGRGAGGTATRIRCPNCGFECAATIEPDGVTRAWCPQCNADLEVKR